MRAFIYLAAALAALPLAAAAQPQIDPTAGPRAAFLRYDDGWRRLDAAAIAATLAPDVDWTNSIGLRILGRPKVQDFLIGLFKQPSFRAGTPGKLVIHAIRMLGPDAALVLSAEDTYGQRVWNTGQTVPVQHTNELTVLQRQAGTWLIVTDLTSDEAHGI